MNSRNLHGLILQGLSNVLADPRSETAQHELDILISTCPPVPLDISTAHDMNIPISKPAGKMTWRSFGSLNALIQFCTQCGSLPEPLIDRLLAYLRHLPMYTWEEPVIVQCPDLPDATTYALVYGLLEIADKHNEVLERIKKAVWDYYTTILRILESPDMDVGHKVAFAVPSFAGWFRALQLSRTLRHMHQIMSLWKHCSMLTQEPLVLDQTRQAIKHCLNTEPYDGYTRRLLRAYWDADVPLSNNRIVYDLLIALRNGLVRILYPVSNADPEEEAAAAAAAAATKTYTPCYRGFYMAHEIEDAWESLIKDDQLLENVQKQKKGPEFARCLSAIYVTSIAFYQDVKRYMLAKDVDKSQVQEGYLTSIKGLSLHVASLASTILNQVDDMIVNCIEECLFTPAERNSRNPWVYAAALDAAALIAIKFPRRNSAVINILCRFLATPSSVFFIECESGYPTEKSDVRKFAIKRLAQCVQAKPPKQRIQAANSTLYALLNEITRFSEERDARDAQDSISVKPPENDFTDQQREQVCINSLSAIVGIAVYLKEDNISAQALSLLLLRRKFLSELANVSLFSCLVDLALASPIGVFKDIINFFTTISCEILSNTDNAQELLFSAVLSAQTDLAKRLKERPEFCSIYLDCILGLFVDTGIMIQRAPFGNDDDRYDLRKNDLTRFLPVLQALLEIEDFDPRTDSNPETMILFRNMWFLCVLFDFVADTSQYKPAMLAIAKKSPAMVTRNTEGHLESDLEYNSVLAGINDPLVFQLLRQRLLHLLPTRQYEIKSMPFAQVVFGLAVYHTETMRGMMGDCTSILYYFMSGVIQAGTPLGMCIEAIIDATVDAFIKETSQKAALQTLNIELTVQMQVLLKRSCHRVRQVHLLSAKVIHAVVNAFPLVFVEKKLVTLLLELIQLVWLSCEAFYRDEYTPIFHFTSDRVGVTLELGDSQAYRNELCAGLYENGKKWLLTAMDFASMEVTGLLQEYLASCRRFSPNMPSDTVHLGISLALEIGKTAARNELAVDFAPTVPFVSLDNSSNFMYGFTSRRYHAGEMNGVRSAVTMNCHKGSESLNWYDDKDPLFGLEALRDLLREAKSGRILDTNHLYRVMLQAAATIVSLKQIHPDFITCLVRIPVYLFTKESMDIGIDVWNWVLIDRPGLEKRVMVEMLTMWQWAQRHRKGLFSPLLNYTDPFENQMSYRPSDKESRRRLYGQASALFKPHTAWIKFLHSRFHTTCHKDKHLSNFFLSLLMKSFKGAHLMSTHSLSRQPRFSLLLLGIKVLNSLQFEALAEHRFRTLVYDTAFNWFSLSPRWHYGPRKSYILEEYKLLSDFYYALMRDTPRLGRILTSSPMRSDNSNIASGIYKFYDNKTRDDIFKQHLTNKNLLLLLLESELSRLSVWCNPLNESSHGLPPSFLGNVEKSMITDEHWKNIVQFAFQVSPCLAVQLRARFVHRRVVYTELHRLIANNTLASVDCPEALVILLGNGINRNAKLELKHLLYWAPVPAVTAANYFLPAYQNHPNILQYAMRVLEYYPIDLTFFYVPQIVQALRYDEHGYVEKYIMEAGHASQHFAHQIIWNMQANFYVDADKDCAKPDPLKPTLERITKQLVDAFTKKDREFYEREFKFFGDITAISGYLKEYIRYGQNEKKPKQKKRLDEELGKIKVEKGVYLPSNPDGEVEEIDRTSGRPLQSHAKAPFMATFKIKKQEEEPMLLSAIFKVGDDCRQDVLALQLIAVFKNIYTSVGLDLYLYPYRVVATAPGRGVIDVIKNAISRDQLGREKVNSMYDYFVVKYGSPDTTTYQRARTNFVQSLAAYSVLSYLLQFKDRHNGNIMLDNEGHILHIDFGFIFDIAPGGITFESSPFKLTTEMVQVMGGGADEQAFKQFSELVVKAYLASRPFAEKICELVALMLDSGLPCFRGETIKRMRTRFQLDKSERVAANFIILRIAESFENQRTVLYDYFQKLTNGIPY